MKRILILVLAAMMCLLCACSSGDTDVEATVAPDTESVSAETNTKEDSAAMPVVDAETTKAPFVEPADYSYNSFLLEDNGFYMEYPSHWERQPASKSVCFTEPVNNGEIPGRIVVTSKKVEEVTDSTRESQLRSYFANILADFDTYEWSDIYTSQPFMGDDTALSVTYSASKDGQLYKGYVILGIKKSIVYVYHFRCAEGRYASMQNVMIRTRDAVAIKAVD